MSAQISAVVTYQNAASDIALDFDSKNRLPTDAVTLDDSTGITVQVQYNLAITDSIASTEAFSWTSVQNIAESIGTGDTPGIGQIYPVTPTDGISVSDSLVFFHDGMLNTNMLNTRLISAGSSPESGTDINITLT